MRPSRPLRRGLQPSPRLLPSLKLWRTGRRTGRRAGKIKLAIIIALATVVGAGIFAAAQLLNKPDPAEKAEGEQTTEGEEGEEHEEELAPAETVDLGEFLVNVLDVDDSLRYVKAEVSLVVHPTAHEEEEGEGGHGGGHGSSDEVEVKELPADQHRLARDAVIKVIATQRFEQLLKDASRDELRELLLAELDEALESYQVTRVLITSFVMQ